MRPLMMNSLRSLHLKHVPQPHNSIRILKAECFGSGKHEYKITPWRIKKFNNLIKLRSHHFPIQYLCKSWPFRQLDLQLKQPVLIPRYQSEYMIELLIQAIKNKYTPSEISQLKFIEYGCGSGALGLSLSKQLKIGGKLLDINKQCVYLSALNAAKNNISTSYLQFIQDDMANKLNYILTQDIVISNPPYLSQAHYSKYLKHQIKRYQDKSALVASQDGMRYINMITKYWRMRTKKGILMLEFDGRMLDQTLKQLEPFVKTDQYHRRRFILLTK